jgi:DGQHR domain-containing protein
MSNDFLKKDAVRINVLQVEQPIGTFYVGVVKASDVIEICSAHERTKDVLESYIGMQRQLNEDRVKEIKTYVKTWDASFPNSVILAINPEHYFFEGETTIYIKRSTDSANIIDGQHRIAGFDKESGKNFDVILTLFPELELEEQAYLFSVINTKMTRINPSLAQDLYAFTTINMPEKLAHNIARDFNKDNKNPWYQKIKMLGKREEGTDSVLSQSAFTKEIVNLICDKRDSYEIRDILKRNNNNRSSLINFYDQNKAESHVFWKPFIGSEDKFIYTVLRDYFLAGYNNFKQDWGGQDKILIKTTGYIALMTIFVSLFKKGLEEKDLTESFFDTYFKKAKASDKLKEFTSKNYPPGKIGEGRLSKDFLMGMGLK